MKVALNIHYSADADKPEETDRDEQEALALIESELHSFLQDLRTRCEVAGLDFTLSA